MTEWCSGQARWAHNPKVRGSNPRSVLFLKKPERTRTEFSSRVDPHREKKMLFIQYYVEYFEDDAEMFWFPQFKRLVRAMFKLMNPSDMDYEATKKMCRAQDMMEVAEICYRHNETYFREEVMDWVELAQTGQRRIRVAPKGQDIHFLRNRFYYVRDAAE